MMKVYKIVVLAAMLVLIMVYSSEITRAIMQKRCDSLKQELKETKAQRDLLSDAIRIAADNGEELSLEQAKYLLEEIDCGDSLSSWSYCY